MSETALPNNENNHPKPEKARGGVITGNCQMSSQPAMVDWQAGRLIQKNTLVNN